MPASTADARLDHEATEPTRSMASGSAPSARAIAVLVAIGVGVVLVAQLLAIGPAGPPTGRTNGAWHPPSSRAERLVAKMDGAAFAQTATDPFLRHTEDDYGGDDVDAAYRSSRPLPGWAYSVASLGGQRPLLAPAILVVTALAIGWCVLSVDVLGRALGLEVRAPWLVALLPATVAAIAYPGIGEPLGLALSMTALACWFRRRPWLAVTLFCAAALCRETMLLVPLGLALWTIVERRSLRPALPLLAPAATYGAWVAVCFARFGSLPSAYSPPTAPFSGMVDGISIWSPVEWLTAVAIVASAVVIVRWGTGWMRWILATHLAFMTTMGTIVWWVWWGFGRVATILPMLALVAWSRRTSPTET